MIAKRRREPREVERVGAVARALGAEGYERSRIQPLAPSVSFHVASAEAMPVADASIALAVSSISLHRWRDQARGLREVARMLRPGGRLCLADITLPRWIATLIRSNARTPAAIRRLVDAAGLELRDQRRILARVIVLAVAGKPAHPV